MLLIKMPREIINGKLVFLRPPEKLDAAEYIAMARASEKFHRGLIRMSRTREEFDAYLERCKNPANANFLICRVSDRAIAGMINLSQIFYGPFENAYLGYGLGAGFTGQGLMAEAVALILKYAFKDLKLHRVEANAQPDNLSSIAVLKRSGFTKEGFSRRYLKVSGRWRDHERWAIIKEDWKRV
jgi:ribosomal-protein-alanine N-acetyltransferase